MGSALAAAAEQAVGTDATMTAEVPSPSSSFVPPEVLAQAGTMNKPQADLCPFGCVQVDDAGRVLTYNRYLSEMSGVSAKQAAGKNYFTQVNPCTNNPMFYGAFKRGVAAGQMDEHFAYLFTHQMRPTPVKVHLVRDGLTKANWIFVKKA